MKTERTHTVLLTDGVGFIGSPLIESLCKETNLSIIALLPPSANLPEKGKIYGQVEWIHADLLDITQMDKIIRKCDFIIHNAEYKSNEKKHKDRVFIYNAQVTEQLINVALSHPIKKLIYISSTQALGMNNAHHPIDETESWEKNRYHSTYGEAKRRAELEIWRGRAEGLPTLIFNPSCMIGAGNWQSDPSVMIAQVATGLPAYPMGSYGFVGLDDVIRAIVLGIREQIEGEQFILNAANMSYRECFSAIAEVANQRPAVRSIPKWSIPFLRAGLSLAQLFSSHPAWITPDNLRLSASRFQYNGKKIKRMLPFSYDNIYDSIHKATIAYCNEILNS